MTLRDQLAEQLRSWGFPTEADLRDDTVLITSGMLDSQGLFNLVLWVEAQIGGTIDPSSFDLVLAWNTVGDVVDFVERRRGS